MQAALDEGITAGEPLSRLTERVNAIFNDPRRAAAIAATESTRAYAEGTTQVWQAAGVPEREWRTAVDERVCPVCGALHQKRAKLGTPFEVVVKGKRVVVDNPPAHPNCRCVVFPVVRPERSPTPGTDQERRVVAGKERTFNRSTQAGIAYLTPVDLDATQQIIDPDLFAEIAKLRTGLPEAMQGLWQEVVLTDTRNSELEEFYRNTEYGRGRIVASTGTQGQITFYANADLSRAEILEYAGEELGHQVARRLFGGWSPQDEDAWYAAMQADNLFPGGEVSVNQAEDFAMLVSIWLRDKSTARRNFPARITLLEQWLSGHAA
jgi:SPP1 gp7 family putative phage head morphogenesis protein